MNLDRRFVIPAESMSRMVGTESVILHLTSGTYFGLDPVGARIWTLLSEGKNLTEICAQLRDEFDVGREQVEADVFRLVAELTERGLIREA